MKTTAPYRVPFYADMVGVHLLVSQPARGVLEDFRQVLHQEFRSDLFISLLRWVLESTIFPTQVDLFHQRKDSGGHPMGGHTDSYQALFLQEVDFVGQGGDDGEFEWGRFFTPSHLELRESTNERRKAGFMILIIEPYPMPSTKRFFQGKVKKASMRTGLKTHTHNIFSVSGTRLIFQEKVVLK
jgi:hypothetical protein